MVKINKLALLAILGAAMTAQAKLYNCQQVGTSGQIQCTRNAQAAASQQQALAGSTNLKSQKFVQATIVFDKYMMAMVCFFILQITTAIGCCYYVTFSHAKACENMAKNEASFYMLFYQFHKSLPEDNYFADYQ